MMHITWTALLLLAAQAFAQAPNVPQNAATAPCSTYVCDVQVDWLRNNGMVGIVASAMPEDKYGFKPTPAQQTFGERVLHVAEINYWLLTAAIA